MDPSSRLVAMPVPSVAVQSRDIEVDQLVSSFVVRVVVLYTLDLEGNHINHCWSVSVGIFALWATVE